MKYINKNTGDVINYETYKLLSDYGKKNFTLVQDKNQDTLSKGVDFGISAVIGATTGSAILGGLLGGDIVGGICGDLFNGDLWD